MTLNVNVKNGSVNLSWFPARLNKFSFLLRRCYIHIATTLAKDIIHLQ